MQAINRTTHPALYAAMDAAASQYWAYPSPEWQNDFIDAWLESEAKTSEQQQYGAGYAL